MRQIKKPIDGCFPRDIEAVCQVLEFMAKRLGVEVDFMPYMRTGAVIDDKGGAIDRLDRQIVVNEVKFGLIDTGVSLVKDGIQELEQGLRLGDTKVGKLDKSHRNVLSRMSDRGATISSIQQDIIRLGTKLDTLSSKVDKLTND